MIIMTTTTVCVHDNNACKLNVECFAKFFRKRREYALKKGTTQQSAFGVVKKNAAEPS